MASHTAREIEELTQFMDDEEIVDLLTESTWEGKWDRVVEIYRQFPWTHMEKISKKSGDTALHAAADSGQEDDVEQLVKIILEHEEKLNELKESSQEFVEKPDVAGSSLQHQQQLGMTQANIIRESEKFQEKLDERAQVKALDIQNKNGNTPLHLAAAKGFMKICKCIVGIEPSEVKNVHAKAGRETIARQYLLKKKNHYGETPLFLAALNWHKDAFVYLNDTGLGFVGPSELIRNNGDTILHCAVIREHFDLAVIIILYYHDYIGSINDEGFTPLAVLATKRSAFLSSTNLTWWDQIIYRCIPVEPLDIESALSTIRGPPLLEASYPKNWVTCCNVINLFLRICGFRDEKNERDIEGERQDVPSVNPTWRTCLEIVTFVLVPLTGSIRIKIKKQKHMWGHQILKELMKEPSRSYLGDRTDADAKQIFAFPFGWSKEPMTEPPMKEPPRSYRGESEGASFPTEFRKASEKDDKSPASTDSSNSQDSEYSPKSAVAADKEETALLVAARNGIVEIVNEILKKLPVTIEDKNSKMRNVLLVAVQNRQPFIVKALKTHPLWANLILGMDIRDNTVLHLAAEGIGKDKPWKIPEAAMQMIWDIKWYEYIKSLVPEHFYLRSNKDEKTPGDIFSESHQKLIKRSSEWLKDTSESCSVVAALIAGVSFATASTVPGGNESETGKPALEGQPAFDLFAMTSLVSLCFSVTALIMFLSILTSRKEAKDFLKDLPLKLLLGLSSLFVSIATMFVSFCAGHFFVVKDKFKNTIYPIYGATCLPVTFYAVAQFPLYIDLVRAIVAKAPHPSDMGGDL